MNTQIFKDLKANKDIDWGSMPLITAYLYIKAHAAADRQHFLAYWNQERDDWYENKQILRDCLDAYYPPIEYFEGNIEKISNLEVNNEKVFEDLPSYVERAKTIF